MITKTIQITEVTIDELADAVADKLMFKIENKKVVAIKDYFDDHYFLNKKLVS